MCVCVWERERERKKLQGLFLNGVLKAVMSQSALFKAVWAHTHTHK